MARYDIDPARSTVWIEARSSLHPINSSTTGLEGFLEIELGHEGTVDLTSPPTGRLSLAVERLSSGNRMEDREMQRRIDARRFPCIEGELGTMAHDGSADMYKVSGDISFRGVSRRHEDLMRITSVDGHTVRLEGSSRFDVRDYGMQPPKILMLKVEPEVTVRVEIIATSTAPEGPEG